MAKKEPVPNIVTQLEDSLNCNHKTVKCPKCDYECLVRFSRVSILCGKCGITYKISILNNAAARAEIIALKNPKDLTQNQRQQIANRNWLTLKELNRDIDTIDMQRKNAEREKQRKDKKLKEDKLKNRNNGN
jgi:ribosomal protein L37AE/L43A